MRIVADENIALLSDFFAHLGELTRYSGRSLSAEQLNGAEVLLVRSVTPVNAQLLEHSQVRFVGSATIGDDHIDQAWLKKHDIALSTAPACNAHSVVEYVFAALAYLSAQKQLDFSNKVLGIIGLGNVGSLLARFAQILGFEVVGYDPFTQHIDIKQVDLDCLLQQADIICLHTPLTKTGTHPSYHLLNAQNLPRIKQGAVLLNAGRGGSIDNVALLRFMQQVPQHLAGLILDVWENEPLPHKILLQIANIATPHIAGYSVEGKSRGTEMIYQALCAFSDIAPKHQLADFLPTLSHILDWPQANNLWHNYARLLSVIYPIEQDSQALKQTLLIKDDLARATAFDALRKHYWPRRESWAYYLKNTPLANKEALQKLGFKIMT